MTKSSHTDNDAGTVAGPVAGTDAGTVAGTGPVAATVAATVAGTDTVAATVAGPDTVAAAAAATATATATDTDTERLNPFKKGTVPFFALVYVWRGAGSTPSQRSGRSGRLRIRLAVSPSPRYAARRDNRVAASLSSACAR